MKIVEMLISRGARVHTTNMGDDTPLHLAAAHGHKEVVQMVSLSLTGTAGSVLVIILLSAPQTEGGRELCQRARQHRAALRVLLAV